MTDFMQEMQQALTGGHEPHYWGCEHCGTPVSRFYANVTEYHGYNVEMENGEPTVQWDQGSNGSDTGDVAIGCPECEGYVDISPWALSKMPEGEPAPHPTDMLTDEEYVEWVGDGEDST